MAGLHKTAVFSMWPWLSAIVTQALCMCVFMCARALQSALSISFVCVGVVLVKH